jgi:pyocin large subunit-like protein
MSFKMVVAVRDHLMIQTTAEYAVLMTLATYAKDDGACWSPVERLAKHTRLTRRGVQKILRHLEHCGQIRVVAKSRGGRGKATRYRIHLSYDAEEVTETNVKTPDSEHGKPRTEFAVIKAVTETETANYDAQNRELSSPDTYLRKRDTFQECVGHTHTDSPAAPKKRRSTSKNVRTSKNVHREKNLVPPLPPLSEVSAYCAKLGLPATDAKYLHDHWLSNGFKKNGEPILNWQAAINARKARNLLPSLEQVRKQAAKSKTCMY